MDAARWLSPIFSPAFAIMIVYAALFRAEPLFSLFSPHRRFTDWYWYYFHIAADITFSLIILLSLHWLINYILILTLHDSIAYIAIIISYYAMIQLVALIPYYHYFHWLLLNTPHCHYLILIFSDFFLTFLIAFHWYIRC